MVKFFFRFPFLLLILILSGCSLGRMLVYNYSDIKDYKKFPSSHVANAALAFHFKEASSDWKENHPLVVRTPKMTHTSLDKFLPSTSSVAFLVIRNDTLIYEQYFEKFDSSRIVPSFSMAKSYTSALLGIAIDEGQIESVEDSISRYIPELRGKGFDKIKIKHLLKMTSGIRSSENYFNPFAGVANLYYGSNLRASIKHAKVDTDPGRHFRYKSLNTQLLGRIIEYATGKSLSALLEEKIWIPLGMEFDASWSVDKKKNSMEKAFCCINARARDFAKFGRLYLNKGNWEGKQLISKNWVEESTKIDAADGSAWYYQYQWWLPSRDGDFMARGHLGQFIYVYPQKNIIIVRLGKKSGDVDWTQVFKEIAAKYGTK